MVLVHPSPVVRGTGAPDVFKILKGREGKNYLKAIAAGGTTALHYCRSQRRLVVTKKQKPRREIKGVLEKSGGNALGRKKV